ncbi:TIGR04282 family arsenosugar biosynthesis glycosyltransferase [Aquiflexum lacus]|uniref:TIGR04282 family arsenosugar biosynthesis glycosyltransferase n=1 Tax=Aquiflexum lacus TaxID=2483805 RepID=UPI001895F29D|nr:TIGR04282 family arsenosugar biosynthesis glycosyltransferase [Aquiflexum lacus]
MKSKNSENAIIIFQKNLIHGKVKTRLAATIGDQKAFEIYKDLVAFTYKQSIGVKDADIWVFFSDGFEEIDEGFQEHITAKMVQDGDDLGQRMQNAFATIFSMGYSNAVLMGTDCPEITPETIETALDSLEKNEVVVGPALDGGYYLIGMNNLYPQLFWQMPWSTENVFPLTLETIYQNNLSHYLLPVLSDIDTEEDWLKFESLISENN